jgi:hypothetical protein
MDKARQMGRAEVMAAVERADLDGQAASDCTNEPVILLATNRRAWNVA